MKITIIKITLIISLINITFFLLEGQDLKNVDDYFQLRRKYIKQQSKSSSKVAEEDKSHKHFVRWNTMMSRRYGVNGSLDSFAIARKNYFDKEFLSITEPKQVSIHTANNLVFDYLGPIGIPSTPYETKGTTGKGWVEDIYVDPSNPDIIYAGTHHSGLWRTTNEGNSWEDLTFDYPLIDGIINFIFDPVNSNIIYVLTGNRYPGADGLGQYSNGIYKSTDNGLTWNELPVVEGGHTYYPSMKIYKLPIKLVNHPTNPSILFLITKNRILRSQDSGNTWSLIRDNNEIYEDAEIDPNDPSIVYVTGNVILKSWDGGITFYDITNFVCGQSQVDKADVAIHENYPEKRWFYIKTSATNSQKSLIKEENGIFSLLGTTYHGGYLTQNIEISPNNENLIYLGGVINKIFNGSTFLPISTTILSNNSDRYGPSEWLHADCRDFCIYDAGTDDIIYIGHDGGVSKGYYDPTNSPTYYYSWEQLSDDETDGLRITEFYGLSVAKNDSEFLMGGAQDLSFFIYDHGNWFHSNEGDGGTSAIDFKNNEIAYHMSSFNNFLKRMKNRGQKIDAEINNHDIGQSLFTQVCMHPRDPTILYHPAEYEVTIGSETKLYNKLIKIKDADSSTPIYEDISPTNKHGSFSAIAVSSKNPKVIYTACDDTPWDTSDRDSLFWRSTDGGLTWTSLSENHSNAFVGHYVTGITINPLDENELWICFMGATNGSNKVLHSEDGGNSWEFLSTGYPSRIPTHCIKYNFLNKTLYVGTEVGIFSYDTQGAGTWQAQNQNLPKIITGIELTHDHSKLAVSTYGYGILQAELETETDCYTGRGVRYTSDHLIDNKLEYCHDIIISGNSTFTITGELKMALGATITVNAGSSLIVDGGSILNADILLDADGTLLIENNGQLILNQNDNVDSNLGSIIQIDHGTITDITSFIETL